MSKRPTKTGGAANEQDKDIYVTSDGGVIKTILKEGSGDPAPAKSHVTVHYVLKLGDGSIVDSSRKRNSPFQFQLNSGSVILGWDKAVSTMRKGETASIKISPDYGYGNRDIGPIPAKSTLFFEVEVIDFSSEPPSSGIFQRVIQLAFLVIALYMFFNYIYPKVGDSIGHAVEDVKHAFDGK